MVKKKTVNNVDNVILVEESYEDALEELLHILPKVKNVGIEADFVTCAFKARLSQVITAKLIPISINCLRIKKTTEEIILMKQAAAINDLVYQDLEKMLKPGLTEKYIANYIKNQMYKYGADEIGFPPIVGSGPNSAIPHHYPGQRRIQAGDLVVIDIGCVVNGYNSDSTRTYGIKHLSSQLKEIYEIVYAAQTAACQNVKIGMKLGEIDQICRQKIKSAGYEQFFTHGTGHGIGIELHEQPFVVPSNNRDVVGNNDIFTIEPGIYLPNVGGVRIEDEVLIHNGQPQLLISTSKKLKILNN